jgi:hypothetical protein
MSDAQPVAALGPREVPAKDAHEKVRKWLRRFRPTPLIGEF